MPELIPIEALRQQLDQANKDNAALKQQQDQLVKENQGLRDGLAGAQRDAEQLRQQIEVLHAPRSPDDFASALRHSLDTLQGRLSGMSNAASDFALKEFHIEANVHISVTALGTIDYRFPAPEDKIDPAALSRLTLTLVPIPKQQGAGAFVPTWFDPNASLEGLPGLLDKQLEVLRQNHIYTAGDLVQAGGRVRSTVELATLLGVDRKQLGDWLGQAQLLTLRGVDSARAQVLHGAGIADLATLAALTPDELVKRYNDKAGTLPHLTPDEAEGWIKAARSYTGARAAGTG